MVQATRTILHEDSRELNKIHNKREKMSLKELTQDNHTLAEQTPFIQAIFNSTLPAELWTDYKVQKYFVHHAIETSASTLGLLDDLSGIERAELLHNDAKATGIEDLIPNEVTLEYNKDIQELTDPDRLMAHMYTWHMGDLHGGQLIKKMVDGPNTALDFDNEDSLKQAIRNKLNDSMADEANIAFTWAIKILNQYKL